MWNAVGREIHQWGIRQFWETWNVTSRWCLFLLIGYNSNSACFHNDRIQDILKHIPVITDRSLGTIGIKSLLNSDGIWSLISFRLSGNPLWGSEISIFSHITEKSISLLSEMFLKYCSLMRLKFIQIQNKKFTYAMSLFPPLFIASLWMDHNRKPMEVCSFISTVVVKYLRHFFDFIYKSASWTSVVLSLTWKL